MVLASCYNFFLQFLSAINFLPIFSLFPESILIFFPPLFSSSFPIDITLTTLTLPIDAQTRPDQPIIMVGGGVCHRLDHHIYPSPSTPPPQLPFHLLEITIISAQDLHPESRRLFTYTSAHVDPDHKLKTHIDANGHTCPSWNDKFIFRVHENFLRSDTSSVNIDIFTSRRFFKDPKIGTASIVLSSVKPSPATKFVALQVRRPKSLRPQGIINVGVSLLDEYIDGMPRDPAFILKDIVKSENDSKEWKLDRSVSKDVGHRVWEEEEKELESKLEQWKVDITPRQAMSPEMDRKYRRKLSCLCGCAKD